MSDDEDYMSDKFLQNSEQRVSSSLIYKHSDKRELALMKKKAEIESRMKERNKSIRVIEAEKREEGLSSAITSANKGLCFMHITWKHEQRNSRYDKNGKKLIINFNDEK